RPRPSSGPSATRAWNSSRASSALLPPHSPNGATKLRQVGVKEPRRRVPGPELSLYYRDSTTGREVEPRRGRSRAAAAGVSSGRGDAPAVTFVEWTREPSLVEPTTSGATVAGRPGGGRGLRRRRGDGLRAGGTGPPVGPQPRDVRHAARTP